MFSSKKSQVIVICIGLMTQMNALEEQPWFYPPFNFHAKGDFDGSFFTNVNNGFNPIDYHSTNMQATVGLLAPISPSYDAEIEAQFESTSARNFGLESAAFQVRRLLLNDIIGEF